MSDEQTPMDAAAAADMIAQLRDSLHRFVGQRHGESNISAADDFAYTDPVDGSRAENQGIRVLLGDSGRIVYRLSGTGTEGATLRVYIEAREADPARHGLDPQYALAAQIALATELARIEHFTGRTAPTVIT